MKGESMKSLDECFDEISECFTLELDVDGSHFMGRDDAELRRRLLAIQRDTLLTVSTGIISMMGAPPWLDSPMGDEIVKRIAKILPEGD